MSSGQAAVWLEFLTLGVEHQVWNIRAHIALLEELATKQAIQATRPGSDAARWFVSRGSNRRENGSRPPM